MAVSAVIIIGFYFLGVSTARFSGTALFTVLIWAYSRVIQLRLFENRERGVFFGMLKWDEENWAFMYTCACILICMFPMLDRLKGMVLNRFYTWRLHSFHHPTLGCKTQDCWCCLKPTCWLYNLDDATPMYQIKGRPRYTSCLTVNRWIGQDVGEGARRVVTTDEEKFGLVAVSTAYKQHESNAYYLDTPSFGNVRTVPIDPYRLSSEDESVYHPLTGLAPVELAAISGAALATGMGRFSDVTKGLRSDQVLASLSLGSWIPSAPYRRFEVVFSEMVIAITGGVSLLLANAILPASVLYFCFPAFTVIVCAMVLKDPQGRDDSNPMGLWSLVLMIQEIFNTNFRSQKATDVPAALSLSDGGHWENLGIIPLMKDRCKLIIAVDGGADPDGICNDLEIALDYARTYLGYQVYAVGDGNMCTFGL